MANCAPPEVAQALHAIEQGGYPEAVIRCWYCSPKIAGRFDATD
jgi:hypothetical protein